MIKIKGGDKVNVSYWKNEATGNYHVTLHAISQTIVLTPGFFRKVFRMQDNVVVGCREVNFEVLHELGFIVPTEINKKIV